LSRTIKSRRDKLTTGRQSAFDFVCGMCKAFLSEKARPTFTCYELWEKDCPILNRRANPVMLALEKAAEEKAEISKRRSELYITKLRRKQKAEKDKVGKHSEGLG
jgi:hypothetical protein